MKKIAFLLGILIILSGCASKQPEADINGSTEVLSAGQSNENLDKSPDTLPSLLPKTEESIKSTEPPVKTGKAEGEKQENQNNSVSAAPIPKSDKISPPEENVVPTQTPTPKATQTPLPTIEPTKIPDRKSSVTLSIIDYEGKFIISSLEVEFKEGDSVLDVLIRVGKEKKISVVYSGRKSNGYVEGINNLFEFDKGPESGWMYSVNGVFGGRSSGSHKLKQGDVIKWIYTKKLGKDIGAGV